MSQTATERVRWTTVDLDLLPNNTEPLRDYLWGVICNHAPLEPSKTCVRICAALDAWSQSTGLGQATIAPGVIFTDAVTRMFT